MKKLVLIPFALLFGATCIPTFILCLVVLFCTSGIVYGFRTAGKVVDFMHETFVIKQ